MVTPVHPRHRSCARSFSLQAALAGVIGIYFVVLAWFHSVHSSTDIPRRISPPVKSERNQAVHPELVEGEFFTEIPLDHESKITSQPMADRAVVSSVVESTRQLQKEPLVCRRVLVTHEYVPYADHHGADTRLLDVLSAFLRLGCSEVLFLAYTTLLDATEVQVWEPPKADHIRCLEELGVKFVTAADVKEAATPTTGFGIGSDSLVNTLGQVLIATNPQFLITTLWFWTFPVRPLWAGIVAEAHLCALAWRRRQEDELRAHQPSRRCVFLVLSDDVHSDREASRPTGGSPGAVTAQATTLRVSERGDRWTVVLAKPQEKAALLAPSARRTALISKLEVDTYVKADAVVAITAEDKRRMEHLLAGTTARSPPPPVFTLRPTASILPLNEGAPFERRSGFLFVGTGQNPTNVAAAQWLLRAVWPRIRAQCPDAELLIAGALPPKASGGRRGGRGSAGGGSSWDESVATAEQQRAQRVKVLGFQKDLTRVLSTARVFLSPVRVASGFNTKNLLALTHNIPLVTTGFGSTGLPAGAAVVVEANDGAGVDRAENHARQGQQQNLRRGGTQDRAASTLDTSPREDSTEKNESPLASSTSHTGGGAEEEQAFADKASILYRNSLAWREQRKIAYQASLGTFSPAAVKSELGAILFQASSSLPSSKADDGNTSKLLEDSNAGIRLFVVSEDKQTRA